MYLFYVYRILYIVYKKKALTNKYVPISVVCAGYIYVKNHIYNISITEKSYNKEE